MWLAACCPNKVTHSQGSCVRSETGHWQGLGLHADSSLLALLLLWSQPAPHSVADRKGCWQQICSQIRVFSLCWNHWGKLWLLFWELSWDRCLAEDSTTDGAQLLKRSRSSRLDPVSVRLYFSPVVLWQWPGERAVIRECCRNEEGGFGSHLECCRALCWRGCILLLLAVSSRPQALH